LALLGAEVIKIENPKLGDLARQLGADPATSARLMGTSFVAVNAGKQSVTINLKTSEGKKLFKEFAAISHVVLENFRPGVMKRLDLDYPVLSRVNPAIVYCAVTGFGQDGPLAMRPAYDQIIQGMSGIMDVTGSAESAPLRVGYPICDTLGGITAALAICAALIEARVTGRGRMIDVSMLEATLASMGWVVSNFLNGGIVPVPMGNENFTAAPSGTFRTADGLLNIAANEVAQYEKLCDLLGRPDLKTDPRFCDRELRRENRAAINREVERALATRGAAEWEALMIAAGVPAGRVLSVPEILGQPHLRERNFVTTFRHPDGTQNIARGGFQFPGDSVRPQSPAPKLSQDTDRWLRELGHDSEEIAALRSKGVI
jgi:crotonobetainyl-CoA:carnitine CoA-transferase CaiB-like acyl-CoA transferase